MSRSNCRFLTNFSTKYDCSAADINPIGEINSQEIVLLNDGRLTRLQGSISKRDIELFFRYAKVEYKLNVLEKSLNAVATAELEAIKENYTQSCISE